MQTNLIGNKFGRWTITNIFRDEIKKRTFANVICDCGETGKVILDNLKNGGSKSCGCLRIDMLKEKENIDKKMSSKKKTDLVENTSLSSLNQKLPSDNKSGYKGVCYVKASGMWEASLTFKGEFKLRESFKNKQDAINARKEAEDKYFKPILDKYAHESK